MESMQEDLSEGFEDDSLPLFPEWMVSSTKDPALAGKSLTLDKHTPFTLPGKEKRLLGRRWGHPPLVRLWLKLGGTDWVSLMLGGYKGREEMRDLWEQEWREETDKTTE